MYRWQFVDETLLDEDGSWFEAASQNQRLFSDADWIDVESDSQPLSDTDEWLPQDIHVIPDAADRGVDHALLTHEQEIAIAQSLVKGFRTLQGTLAQHTLALDAIYQQVTAEAQTHNPESFDPFITLYDTWLVYGELARRDQRFASEREQIWQRLLAALRTFDLNRDFTLALAEGVSQSADGKYRARIRRCLQQVYAIRNQFVSANIRLVYHVARRHMDRGMNLEDMVQEGILGLLRAALKFDPDVGVRFSTYSFWWIKQAIRQAIGKQRSLIRYPTHVTDQVNRVYGVIQDYLRQHGRKPGITIIQQQTGYSTAKVKDLLALTNFCVSANACLFDDGEKTLQDELIYDASDWQPANEAALQLQQDQLKHMLAWLSPREAQVLKMKFGIGQRRAYSLNEIAPQIGVSRERVRQISEEALAKLKARGRESGYFD